MQYTSSSFFSSYVSKFCKSHCLSILDMDVQCFNLRAYCGLELIGVRCWAGVGTIAAGRCRAGSVKAGAVRACAGQTSVSAVWVGCGPQACGAVWVRAAYSGPRRPLVDIKRLDRYDLMRWYQMLRSLWVELVITDWSHADLISNSYDEISAEIAVRMLWYQVLGYDEQ